MNDLVQLFKKNIEKEKLFQKNDLLLLAVSGGVDSVALCELCLQSGFHFLMVHCNFQLRGEESHRDEQFVQSLAERYGVRLFVNRFDTADYVVRHKVSVQVAARELRYQWFEALRIQLSVETKRAVWIVTAHHADDNIETVLMNFFKGTGVSGMRGMMPKANKIIRPLLFARKQELVDFAVEKELRFVEDSSNESDKYSRNFIRHRVIPLLRERYPAAPENILADIERFRDIEWLYQEAVALHKKNLLEERGNEVYIPVLKLSGLRPFRAVLFEIIKAYGFTAKQTDDAVDLLHAETGKYIRSSSHRLLRHRKWLVIAPLQTDSSGMILIKEGEAEVVFGGGRLCLSVERVDSEAARLSAAADTAFLDAGNIQFPLILRRWKEGDYFYPLGMEKKKKLARFFIDRKLSLTEKEKIWVLEMNKKIIWVVGQRIDNRFKVAPGTKTVLKISLKV